MDIASENRGPLRYAGPALIAVAGSCIAVVAALGPSAAEAPLGAHDSTATPPWHLDAHPSGWLVTGLLVLAVAAATLAVALGLTGRWRPRPRRLLAAGILAASALAVLPPIGSADTLSYAAYGRMAVIGHDPWTTTPRQVAERGDPVNAAVEIPWQDTPSVYGPLAEGEQALASELAGRDVALTVLLLDLVGAAAFVAGGLALHAAARDDAGRRRAALCWTANPLLWLELVAGGHLDVLVAALGLAAVLAARRNRLVAGVLAGLAIAVKAPAGLVLLALAWAARRSRRDLAAVLGGAVVVAGTGYALAGAGVFRQLSRASRMVSLGTPWRPVADVLDPLLGDGAGRRLVGVGALALLVVLVAVLRRAHPAIGAGEPAALALAGTLAYSLAAAYSLPWYDALPWALLPLVAASRLDGLLLAHMTVLTLAYLPGRAAVHLTGPLHVLTTGMRQVVSPTLIAVLLVWLVWSAVWRRSRIPT